MKDLDEYSTATAAPRLCASGGFSRARALKLHEHFLTVAHALKRGAFLKRELERVSMILDGAVLSFPKGDGTLGEAVLRASYKTLDKEWRYWLAGGRKGEERDDYVCRSEALLLAYKPGCGGHRAMPRALVRELHRRATLPWGGRDKHGKAPISEVFKSLKADFEARKPLPGIDYDDYPVGAEFPWSCRTIWRKKPSRGLRAAGNRGAAAYKSTAAYVSLDYSKLRKCELYTLDDVRLDIVCMHEATGEAVGAVCYILMEVASRMIVAYVIKPCVPDAAEGIRRKAITEEDVSELLAYGLQAPGFGIGVGYTTHLLFERGTTACSEPAQMMLEGVTRTVDADGVLSGIKVHKTSILGGVRWIGAPRDQARGNSTGKAVIESFNRRLHYALLHLPGQRGNHADNQPENMGVLGKPRFRFDGNQDAKNRRQNGGTQIDEDEYLAQLNLATGGTMKLRLNSLYFRELDAEVREAIARHNSEPGHAYRGHGTFDQAEVAPGVWKDRGSHETGGPATGPRCNGGNAQETQNNTPEPTVRTYTLNESPWAMGPREKAAYWQSWSRVAKARPDLDRHAITRRVLGCNVRHADLSRPQWAKLLRAFAAIVREAGKRRGAEGAAGDNEPF